MKRLLFLLTMMSVATLAAAQDINAHKQRKAQLEKEIAIIDKQLADNASQSKNALAEITLVRKKIENRRELVSQSEKEISDYSSRIVDAQRQINKYQAQVDTLSEYYARLVKSCYKNRDAKIWYMYIIASEDLGQAFRRYSYFKTLSSQMKDQARKIRETQAELESQKARMQDLRQEAEIVKAQRLRDIAALSKEEKHANHVVEQLKKNKSQYEKELTEKHKQVAALNKEIKRLVEEALREAREGSRRPVDTRLSVAFAANRGKLPWPAEGPVVDHYGPQNHPVYPNLKLPENKGINIALPKETKVKAIFEGVVKQVQIMPGYSQCVMVQHGNYFSLYCKLTGVALKAGDTVATGQTIGTIDTIGGQTQLHFQIWRDMTPQNPELWLQK